MSARTLIETFNKWRAAGESFALVTVTETAGSTYSKAGRLLLIKADGQHAGLLSGGCLEGDLAEHAKQVITTGVPKLVTYDMRDDADDLWGIGLGCNGMMRALLQRVDEHTDWQPLQALADALAADHPHVAALVVASEHPDVAVGNCTVAAAGAADNNWPAELMFAPPATLPATTHVATHAGQVSVMYWQLSPWTPLLLLGAGPDAVPVVRAAKLLGWQVTVADHRPHYIESGGFTAADAMHLAQPEQILSELAGQHFNAIVVMSHHLETDRCYLRQLADMLARQTSEQTAEQKIAYIGILGPAARKQKLLDELGDDCGQLAACLRGPVGLDIGADDPETIALSLVSEIQSVVNNGTGNPLSKPD